MGENISKADIQYAMQNALQGIRNDVTRISHIVDCVPRTAQDVQNLARRLATLERDVSQIQAVVASTFGRSSNRRSPDPYLVSIATELNDLKLRFAAIEEFAVQMSDYVRKHEEKALKERQYRTA